MAEACFHLPTQAVVSCRRLFLRTVNFLLRLFFYSTKAHHAVYALLSHENTQIDGNHRHRSARIPSEGCTVYHNGYLMRYLVTETVILYWYTPTVEPNTRPTGGPFFMYEHVMFGSNQQSRAPPTCSASRKLKIERGGPRARYRESQR